MQETPAPTIDDPAPLVDLESLAGIVASIVIVMTVGGGLLLALRGLEAAKVMVPPGVVDNITNQIVTAITSTMDHLQDQARSSPNPFDDALLAAGRIPVDVLIEEMSRRSLSSTESLRAIQAIQHDPDATAGISNEAPH